MKDAKYTAKRRALIQTEIPPSTSCITEDGSLFVDFGKAAFGTLIIPIPKDSSRNSIVVHLGENLSPDGRIDRSPPGSIRYIRIEQKFDTNQNYCRITIPKDERNTGPGAIKMPSHLGEVYPFRYAEIEVAKDIDT